MRELDVLRSPHPMALTLILVGVRVAQPRYISVFSLNLGPSSINRKKVWGMWRRS
jgi:hypothetical protein